MFFLGAIGLSLADQVSKVIGVEVVDQAVEDARWNAAFNGVSFILLTKRLYVE